MSRLKLSPVALVAVSGLLCWTSYLSVESSHLFAGLYLAAALLSAVLGAIVS